MQAPLLAELRAEKLCYIRPIRLLQGLRQGLLEMGLHKCLIIFSELIVVLVPGNLALVLC